MATPITLDQALDTVLQLPPDQQQALVDLLRSRRIEARRGEIAEEACAARAAWQRGDLPVYDIEDAIGDLQRAVTDE